jgi:hypothetical protein
MNKKIKEEKKKLAYFSHDIFRGEIKEETSLTSLLK